MRPDVTGPSEVRLGKRLQNSLAAESVPSGSSATRALGMPMDISANKQDCVSPPATLNRTPQAEKNTSTQPENSSRLPSKISSHLVPLFNVVQLIELTL